MVQNTGQDVQKQPVSSEHSSFVSSSWHSGNEADFPGSLVFASKEAACETGSWWGLSFLLFISC